MTLSGTSHRSWPDDQLDRIHLRRRVADRHRRRHYGQPKRTISSAVYVGAPQSWNVASGKTLTVSGALHTIISDLTFTGAGNTTISGAIDGGGVLNTVGGAKPGGLIQAGTGQSPSPACRNSAATSRPKQAPARWTSSRPAQLRHLQRSFLRRRHHQHQLFRRLFAGRHRLELQRRHQYAATRNAQVHSWGRRYRHVHRHINTTGPIVQDGPGETILSGSCAYPYGLTIASGTLGLRDVSDPTLLAGNFSVGGGTLEFNTATIDSDFTGVVSGSGGLNKSGAMKLTLSGSTVNTYAGDTNILQGSLDLNKTSGYAIPGNLNLSPVNGVIFVRFLGDNQIAPSATINCSGNAYKFIELLGHSLTVAAISDPNGSSFVENSEAESGDYSTGVLTIDSPDNSVSVFKGCLRNNSSNGTGTLALVKNGSGSLTISGNRCGLYTGGLTVNAGVLDYSGGTLPACDYTINGGTLNTGLLSKSIGAFRITGGTVTGSGTLTSSSNFSVRGGTVNPILAGAVGLNKSGPDTAVLNGANSYTGVSTVTNGTLQLGPAAQNACSPAAGPIFRPENSSSTTLAGLIPRRRSRRSWTPATGTVPTRSPPARFTAAPPRRPAWPSVGRTTPRPKPSPSCIRCPATPT